MARSAAWLPRQLARRNLARQADAEHTGVSDANLSDTLNRGNVPFLDILCRHAYYFGIPCADPVLRGRARDVPVS